MALATKENAPAGGSGPTSLDTKETSPQQPAGMSYRQKLLIIHQEEYDATVKAYSQLDSINDRQNIEALESCRDNAWYAVHLQSRTVRVLSNACRLRWCPMCSSGRAQTIIANVQPWLEKVRRPKFLTLTLRHTDDDLLHQIQRLYASFSLFRRRRCIDKAIRGGVWFFQITFSEQTRRWHPHLHCVVDAEYIPHRTIKATWKSVTGNSEIVDIRAIHNPAKAAEYVARYAARPALLKDLDTHAALVLVVSLQGRRLCGTWGTAKEIKLTPKAASVDSDYVSLCSYADLKALAEFSDFAGTCRACYQEHKPLPERYNVLQLEAEIAGMWGAKPRRKWKPPPIKEPYLWSLLDDAAHKTNNETVSNTQFARPQSSY